MHPSTVYDIAVRDHAQATQERARAREQALLRDERLQPVTTVPPTTWDARSTSEQADSRASNGPASDPTLDLPGEWVGAGVRIDG